MVPQGLNLAPINTGDKIMRTHKITLEFDEDFYEQFEIYIEFIAYGTVEDFATDLIFSYIQNSIKELNEIEDSLRRKAEGEFDPLDYDDGIPF